MAIYLYNLEFSLTGSNVNVGNFEPYPTTPPPSPVIGNMSCAWFTASTPSLPGAQPYYQPVTQALAAGNWTNPQTDANDITLDPGDVLLVRVFTQDANVSTYQARFTGVFGQGMSAPVTEASSLQSPLVMSSASSPNNAFPRTVIDADGTTGPSWPAPLSDGSWVLCLGKIVGAPNDAANDYTFNVGVSVYVNSTGNVFTFGRDPRMHVTGVGLGHKHKHKHGHVAA
jgi:protein involved in polysaccharide export with SLBB domain